MKRRHQGWGWELLLKQLSKILATTGLEKAKAGPKDEAWLKRGLGGTCVKFGQGESF